MVVRLLAEMEGMGGADRRNARLPVSGVLPLLQEAVQHDDGIVDGQSQLEHHRHRVGDKGDLSEDEVRAQIQQAAAIKVSSSTGISA